MTANRITRDDIVDYQTYSDTRDDTRARVLEVKARRRIHVGEHLTFLFENKDTLVYQIQEMMRIERIARESDILHEIETYGAMLGGPGQLGCSLLIEIEEAERRAELLTAWQGLERRLYVRLADGTKVYADVDDEQVGDDRLSAVQYLRFTLDEAPVAVGTDFEALAAEVELTPDQQAALADDLAASRAG